MPDLELHVSPLWMGGGERGEFTMQLGHDLAQIYIPKVIGMVWGDDVAGRIHPAFVTQECDDDHTADIAIALRPLYRLSRAQQLGRLIHELDAALREVCPALATKFGIELPWIGYQVNFKFGGGRNRLSFDSSLTEPWFSEVPRVMTEIDPDSARLDMEALQSEAERARERLTELDDELERLQNELDALQDEANREGLDDTDDPEGE